MLCITAIEDFCFLAVSLALDKLSSDVPVAKLDSVTLLVRIFKFLIRVEHS